MTFRCACTCYLHVQCIRLLRSTALQRARARWSKPGPLVSQPPSVPPRQKKFILKIKFFTVYVYVSHTYYVYIGVVVRITYRVYGVVRVLYNPSCLALSKLRCRTNCRAAIRFDPIVIPNRKEHHRAIFASFRVGRCNPGRPGLLFRPVPINSGVALREVGGVVRRAPGARLPSRCVKGHAKREAPCGGSAETPRGVPLCTRPSTRVEKSEQGH